MIILVFLAHCFDSISPLVRSTLCSPPHCCLVSRLGSLSSILRGLLYYFCTRYDFLFTPYPRFSSSPSRVFHPHASHSPFIPYSFASRSHSLCRMSSYVSYIALPTSLPSTHRRPRPSRLQSFDATHAYYLPVRLSLAS